MNGSVTTELLIERARQGDKKAYGVIVERYRDRLRGFVCTRIDARAEVEHSVDDVVQETFLRALEALVDFEWQGESLFFRWLCGIARHAMLHTATRRSRRDKLAVPVREEPVASPSHGMRQVLPGQAQAAGGQRKSAKQS